MHGFWGGAPNDRMSLASSRLRDPPFRDLLPLNFVPRDFVPLDFVETRLMRLLLWDPLRPRLIFAFVGGGVLGVIWFLGLCDFVFGFPGI